MSVKQFSSIFTVAIFTFFAAFSFATHTQTATNFDRVQMSGSSFSLLDPLPTPTPTAEPGLIAASHKGLSDCRFVLDDPACNVFFGMTKPAITAIFGEAEGYGDYSKLGLFFYFNADKIDEITFYGVNNEFHAAFYGKPGRRLNWHSSVEEAIRVYGEPTKRWENDEKTESSLTYDETVRLHFEKNRLTKIVVRDPKADARYLARRAAADAKEARDREQQAAIIRDQVSVVVANEAAKRIMAEYESMHDRVESNIRRAEATLVEARKLQLQGMGNMARQKRDAIYKTFAESRDLIDAFLQKHGGSIPASMKAHLLEDRAKLIEN